MLTTLVLALAITIPNGGTDLPKTQSTAITRSTQGYAPSLYQGRWYSPRWEDERKCIMARESHYNYRAANKSSSARGAYQFLDKQWRVSLTYMLMPEHRDRKREVLALRKKPINQWSRYWQDAAFFTAWRNGKGRNHWYHAGIRCF